MLTENIATRNPFQDRAMLSRFRQIFAQPSIAIDLGTANTRIYAYGEGNYSEEPSLVRYVRQNQEINPPDAYLSS